jgi:hypothetical protein
MLMEPMKLSFGALLAYLNRAIVQMEDPRQASNGTKYSLKDAVLAAFSVFFMQSESFLDYQRHLESHHGNGNLPGRSFAPVDFQQCSELVWHDQGADGAANPQYCGRDSSHRIV